MSGTMKMTLQRRYKCDKYTIGSLYVDGKYFCDTIEDKDRGLTDDMSLLVIKAKKVFSKTAIPTGTYKVDMNTVSSKFRERPWAKKYNGIVPRLLSVPGFDGILIHVGTDENSTSGCVIVGENKIKGKVINSAKTFDNLMEILIFARDNNEDIFITIR